MVWREADFGLIYSSASVDTILKMIAFSIERLRGALRELPVDLYLKISGDHVVHVFSKQSGIDYQRLAQYFQKGVTELWIKAEDKEALEKYLSTTAFDLIQDSKLSKEKKIAAIINVTEQNLSECFLSAGLDESVARNTGRVVKSYIELVAQEPKGLALLLKLVSHGQYLYYHTVAVTVFSILIAERTGRFTAKEVEDIGQGAFWHDVGLGELANETKAIDEASNPFHSADALKLLEQNPNIPDAVKYIVYQHHERWNGKGTPNALGRSAIFLPSQIVAVADTFCSALSQGRTAYDILTMIWADVVSEELFPDFIVEAAIQVFVPEKLSDFGFARGKKAA